MDTTCHLLAKAHPLKGEVLHCELPVGYRLEDVLEPGGFYVVEVDGKRVKNYRDIVVTEEMRKIAVVGRPGEPASAGAAVAAIFFAAGTTAYLVVAWAVTALLYLSVVAALVMVATLDIPKASSTGPPKRLNSLTGSRNKFNPYGPLPVVYGQRRMYPAVAAPPYTELLGKDQYLNMLFLVSVGEVDVSAARLGDNSIYDYENIQFTVHHPSPPTWFDVGETPVGVDLDDPGSGENPISTATMTSAASSTALSIDLTMGQGLLHTRSGGDRDAVRLYLRIDYKASNVADTPANWVNVRGTDWVNATAGDGLVVGRPGGSAPLTQDLGEIWRAETYTRLQLADDGGDLATSACTRHAADATRTGYTRITSAVPVYVDPGQDIGIRRYSGSISNKTAATAINTAKYYNGSVTFTAGNKLTLVGSNPFTALDYINIDGSVADYRNVGNCRITSVSGLDVFVDAVIYTAAAASGIIVRCNTPTYYSSVLVLTSDLTTLDSGTSADRINTGNAIDFGIRGTKCFLIFEENSQPFRIGLKWSVTAGQYDVRVSRQYMSSDNTLTGADPGNYSGRQPESYAKYQSRVSYAILRSYTNSLAVLLPAPRIPATYISMRIRANDQLTGTLDNLSVVASRRLRAWTGSAWATAAPTRSPAWAALDMLINPSVNQRAIYDPAAPLDPTTTVARAAQDAQINLAAFKAWDDGLITTEGFQYDEVIDYDSSVSDALRRVGAVAWGGISVADGRFTVLVEQASPPKQLFTPKNTWDFSSSKVLFDIPHAVKIEFDSALSDNEQDEFIVYDDGYNATGTNGTASGRTLSANYAIGAAAFTLTGGSGTFNVNDVFTLAGETGAPYTVASVVSPTSITIGAPGLRIAHTSGQALTMVTGKAATRFESVRIPGLTSAGNAWKHGRRLLAMGKLRPEIYTFKAGLDNLLVQRGDVVSMQSDAGLIGMISARIIDKVGGSSPYTLTLDEPWQTAGGGTPYAMRAMSTADLTYTVQSEVVATPSAYNTEVVSWTVGAGADEWRVGDLVALGTPSLVTRDVKLLSIVPGPDLTAEITAVDETLGIYSAHLQTIPAYDAGVTQPPDPTRITPQKPTITSIETHPNMGIVVEGGGRVYYASVNYNRGAAIDTFTSLYAVIRFRLKDDPTGYGANGAWRTIEYPDASGTALVPVEKGVTYEFQVRLIPLNGAPSSLWSDGVTSLIAIDATTLELLDDLVVTGVAGGFSVKINTTAMTSTGVSHFEILHHSANDRSASTAIVQFVAAPGTLQNYVSIPVFVPDPTGGASTRYFWSRWVDIYGNTSTYFPGGAVTGTGVSALSIAAGAGADGPPGVSTAILNAYIRATAAPSGGTLNPGDVTYTFATPSSWTPGNGWSRTFPSGTDPIWAESATASGTSSTDSVLAADWTAPIKISEGGAGSDGYNVASVYLYQRTSTSSAPASLPTGNSTYTFSTGGLTFSNAQGWTQAIPAFSGANYWLWITLATASSTATTYIIPAAGWQTAVKLSQDGTNGTAGTNGLPGYLSLAIRANYSAFGTTGNGYVYIHGYNPATGAAADSVGKISAFGNSADVPIGRLRASLLTTADSYILFDTLAQPFTGTGWLTTNSPLCMAKRFRAGWKYDNGSAWTPFTPGVGALLIGTYTYNSTTITSVGVYGNGVSPMSVPVEDASSVQAGDIAASAITNIAAFAGGMRPPIVSSTEPVSPIVGDTWFKTTDNLLYKCTAIGPPVWVRAVDGPDLSANSITGGKLTVGAIGAREVAAEAITASKLAVQSYGMALNRDPTLSDLGAWTIAHDSTTVISTGWTKGVDIGAAGMAGPLTLRYDITGSTEYAMHGEKIPIDAAKTYRVSMFTRTSSGLQPYYVYLGICFRNSSGGIVNTSTGWTVAPQASGSFNYWTYFTSNTMPLTHTRYAHTFGPNGGSPIPAGASTMQLLILPGNSPAGARQYVEFQDYRLEEVIPGVLIQDGAVTAQKLAANIVLASRVVTPAETGNRIELEGSAELALWIGSGTKGTSAAPGLNSKLFYDRILNKLRITGVLQATSDDTGSSLIAETATGKIAAIMGTSYKHGQISGLEAPDGVVQITELGRILHPDQTTYVGAVAQSRLQSVYQDVYVDLLWVVTAESASTGNAWLRVEYRYDDTGSWLTPASTNPLGPSNGTLQGTNPSGTNIPITRRAAFFLTPKATGWSVSLNVRIVAESTITGATTTVRATAISVVHNLGNQDQSSTALP